MWSPETHSDTERFESLNQETVLGDFIALSGVTVPMEEFHTLEIYKYLIFMQ
jgi:hypothetical protein